MCRVSENWRNRPHCEWSTHFETCAFRLFPNNVCKCNNNSRYFQKRFLNSIIINILGATHAKNKTVRPRANAYRIIFFISPKTETTRSVWFVRTWFVHTSGPTSIFSWAVEWTKILHRINCSLSGLKRKLTVGGTEASNIRTNQTYLISVYSLDVHTNIRLVLSSKTVLDLEKMLRHNFHKML